MRRLIGFFLRGLTTVLPAALTLYILWWLGSSAERVMGWVFKLVVPERFYLPGLGLVTGIGLVIAIGALTHAWLLQRLGHALERLVERTPVVKTIYGSIKDLMSFVRQGDSSDRMQSVVTVRFQDTRVMGFVTRESVDDILGESGADQIAVYVPMSYQIGGFMLFVPRDAIEPLDLEIEEGLRLALTAGVRKRRDRGDD